ncbi:MULTISPECIES: molybdenum cofactor guanylyltransferase [Thermodesulfovibrio]|uniref:molybdenum cofactor guanylyltransferase n=1 Tax=Thermodesulfovibrio TaxID=28261 RepID=UPI0013E8E4D5|nr:MULTISPECIES: molybdenum cofactor guanylyltransferase [Thermodesulfovibrio]
MQLFTKIPLTAAILAGGKSSRMKRQKCLLSFDNEKIIDMIVTKLKDIFEELFIVTNFPELYFYTGITLLGDIYPFRGPMSGIHVAIKNSKHDIFAFACDMPFVKGEVICALSEKHIKEANTATVPSYNGKIYPLPGIYSRKLLDELEKLLLEDKLSMTKFLNDIGAEIVEVANLDKEGLSFININTEEDLENLKKGGIKCLD